MANLSARTPEVVGDGLGWPHTAGRMVRKATSTPAFNRTWTKPAVAPTQTHELPHWLSANVRVI